MKTEKGGGMTDVVMSDSERVVGLAQIKDFRGETMHINPLYLKRAVEMADALLEDVNDIEIGTNNETPGGAFFILLNEKKSGCTCCSGEG